MAAETGSQTPVKKSPNGLGRAALWLGGSALFGSLALVLWNQRALRSMHEAAKTPVEPVRPRDDDGIY
jgi:hypothetical protein